MQVNFYLDTRSISKRGHTIKVSFRANYSSKIKSTNLFSHKEEWTRKGVKRSHPNYYEVNDELDRLISKMRKAEIIYSNIDDAISFVFNEVNDDFYLTALKEIEKIKGRNKASYLKL